MEFMWGGGSRGRDAMREGDHEGRGEGVCTRISETEYPSYSCLLTQSPGALEQ